MEKSKKSEISIFQKNAFTRVQKLLGYLTKDDHLKIKLNPECFAMNFLRWKTEKVDDVKSWMEFIEGEYETNRKDNLEIVDTVQSAFLTYSNQFWWPEHTGRKIISSINFS